MPSALDASTFQRTLREFCAAIYGAQCLVAAGELGPRVSALMRYADTLLDALDVELLEAGLAPEAPELGAAAHLRERFQRLLLLLVSTTLRQRVTLPAPRRHRTTARRSASARNDTSAA